MNIKNKIALLGLLSTLCFNNIIYSETFIVTNVDNTNDIVTITNANGFDFQFSGVNDYCENDLVSCIMFSNYTDTIFDDIIINVKYTGYIELFEQYKTY